MKFFNCSIVVIIYLLPLVLGRSSQNSVENSITEEKESSRKAPSYFGDAKFLYKTYQDCLSSDLSTCLKLKLFSAFDRLSRSMNEFKVYEGVAFVKEGDEPEDKTILKSEKEIEAALPRSLEDREKSLNSLIMDKIISFFSSRTLKVKFPSAEEMKRSMDEGRGKDGIIGGGGGGGGGGIGGGKDKKNGHYIMIPLLLGSTLVPLAFGALALLAGKALIVSKLALALASIIGIKKLISGSNHHHDTAHEVVVSGGHGGSGWGRNYFAQNLAYKNSQPQN